jgi:hypothetical protein
MQERGSVPDAPAAWLEAVTDPARDALLASGEKPDLSRILGLFEPTSAEPAFDRNVLAGNVERLRTTPEVDTGHPFLDLSVRTALAHIDATFQGDHPKYGVGEYGRNCHDGFPPVIIATVDALSAWGLHGRAVQLLRYWLLNLVREDGWVRYRGTSVSELGQLLHTAALLAERAGPEGWLPECSPALARIAGALLRLQAEAGPDGLLRGVPEDDEKDKPGRYFHNSAWASRGLERWAELADCCGVRTAAGPDALRAAAAGLAGNTVAAVRRTWPTDPADWWLPPQVEPIERPRGCVCANRIGSYTNYRYWPELLSSGVLPPDLANRVVEARLQGGGQFCGMTRFMDWLDDWPLAEYLHGLRALGRRDDFLLSLYGHVAYHQAREHLTAYEQVTFPPGRPRAAYCLPCQLVAARAARLLV